MESAFSYIGGLMMKKYELQPLSAADGEDVYAFLQTLPREENGFMNSAAGLTYDEYKSWLTRQAANAKKTEIEDGWRVPSGIWWFFVDDKPVGMVKLRYFLTDALREGGGHVGYAVAPAERGHGYAAMMLEAIKPIAAQKGIGHMLITVHNDNLASICTALKCGGRIERISEARHYIWIACK